MVYTLSSSAAQTKRATQCLKFLIRIVEVSVSNLVPENVLRFSVVYLHPSTQDIFKILHSRFLQLSFKLIFYTVLLIDGMKMQQRR
jgi:hypothetical protein